jgi:hypothetical protein
MRRSGESPGGQIPFGSAELRKSERLRAESHAAYKLGISHKRFVGWEPRRVTTVTEWTEEGWPRQWITETEAEWDEEERELRLAYLADQADTCSGCGHPLEESTSNEADPNNPDGKYLYQPSNPLICFSCEVREKTIKRLKKLETFKDRDVMIITRRVERS